VQILNALYAQNTLYKQVTSKVEGITHPYLNVGRIEGGTNTNVVPGKVCFKLDRRMIPEENPAEVEAEVRRVIATRQPRVPASRWTVKRLLLANAMKPLPGNKPLVDAIQKHGSGVRRAHPAWARRCTPTCACTARRHPRRDLRRRPAHRAGVHAKRADEHLAWKTCAGPPRWSRAP
jgi:acetylornithine deacetylase/succinyl-diaminopimelate desuccinylase-like protein